MLRPRNNASKKNIYHKYTYYACARKAFAVQPLCKSEAKNDCADHRKNHVFLGHVNMVQRFVSGHSACAHILGTSWCIDIHPFMCTRVCVVIAVKLLWRSRACCPPGCWTRCVKAMCVCDSRVCVCKVVSVCVCAKSCVCACVSSLVILICACSIHAREISLRVCCVDVGA